MLDALSLKEVPSLRVLWQLLFPYVTLIVIFLMPTMLSAAVSPPDVGTCDEVRRLAQGVAEPHGVIQSQDGACLFYHYWPATNGAADGPVALVLHGIGYYSGPYHVIADAWNARGIGVYAMDARSHGLSMGRRQHVGSPDTIRADVGAMLAEVRRQHPRAAIFLVGESMGGALALQYASHQAGELAGLILMAPALSLSWGQFLRLSNIPLIPYFLFCPSKPVVNLVDDRLEESSRDPKFIAERRADPWAYKRVSFGYLKEVQRLVKGWETRMAAKLDLPTLILQGEQDKLIDKNEVKELAQKLSGKWGPEKAELQLYRDSRHTLLWDPETPRILEDARQWIERKAPEVSAGPEKHAPVTRR